MPQGENKQAEEEAQMRDWMSSNSMRMLQSSMRYLWTNQAVLMDNIVNADTPNYKAKYVTFEDTFKAKIEAAAAQPKLRGQAMRQAVGFDSPQIKEAEDQSYRMDDNGVDVAEQQIEFYRNTIQSQYVLDSINNNFTILRSAIRG